tara:strand:- start:6236 stop:6889 length:654 start_codon:yes stop_codon:yes gene_type:complete
MSLFKQIYWMLRDIAYRNRWQVESGNSVIVSDSARSAMKKVNIKVRGKGNCLVVGDRTYLSNCEVRLYGENNAIEIGSDVRFKSGKLYMLQTSGQHIRLGNKTTVEGAYLLVDEAASIDVGNDCMLSTDIIIRVGDKHSILDLSSGERINPAKDVVVSDHVWIGRAVQVLKGSRLSSGSVVGACSVVSGAFEEDGCILAGVPARLIRRGIGWDRDLI